MSLLLLIFFGSSQSSPEASGKDGEVVNVTLYRGQAQVTRRVALPKGTGSKEIVVSNLPQAIISSSLFAEGAAGIEVQALRYRERYLAPEDFDDSEIRKLDEALAENQQALEMNNQLQALVKQQLNYINSLEEFVAPSAQVELTKGVLDVEALKQLTLFSFEQRQDLMTKQVELKQEQGELDAIREQLQEERQKLTNEQPTSQQMREAVIFFNKSKEESSHIFLSYLVASSGWQPAYNFRADTKSNEVTVEYNALIQQISGEDWNNVNLTLSTATPSLSASGPALGTFPVTLTQSTDDDVVSDLEQQVAGTAKLEAPADFSNAPPHGGLSIPQDAYGNILSAQQSAKDMLEQTTSLQETLDLSFALNSAANAVSLLEVLAKNKSPQDSVQIQEELSLNYDFKDKVSIASRRDQQIIRISESTVEASFFYVATPVLTELIYREAELKNSSDADFLAGSVSTYLDGKFVGRTEIDAIARGQSFTLGFGADPQLRASRRLVEREKEVQGGNQLINLHYELRLENFSEEAVKVRLLDRLPLSDNSLAIKISLGEVSTPLSKDAAYKRLEHPKGILRWDVGLEAEASGEKAFSLEYDYRLEFDRNYQLSTPSQIGELQEEFERFQKERMMKQ